MNSAIQCGPGTSLSASAKELKATKETHQPVEKIKNKAMAVLILKWLLDLKDISALASDAKLISVQMFPIDQDMQQPS
ncbi:MAG: hypothetical protein NPIRA06_14720 [Nitrospirales bacterium]|nr:MAG: hypothetical protein NPIRA06_14720 [Nitrospirales bacterium]